MPLLNKRLNVSRTSAERFRSTARATPKIIHRAQMLKGDNIEKVKKIALRVLRAIPREESLPRLDKKRIFRRSAQDSIFKKKAIGAIHCSERCNSAIALLNAAGVKAWLARVFVRSPNPKSSVEWHFHDFVEFEHNGGLITLAFGNTSFRNKYDFYIMDGPVDAFYQFKEHPIVFRGADSRQIGGVKDWETYKKYVKKLSNINGLMSEFQKNRSRIDLLMKEGVIPEKLMGYM